MAEKIDDYRTQHSLKMDTNTENSDGPTQERHLIFWIFAKHPSEISGAINSTASSRFMASNLFHPKLQSMNHDMTLEETVRMVRECAKSMDAKYGRVVFDEWVIVSLLRQQARVCSYSGPRNDDFLKNFANDLGALRGALLKGGFQTGDFEFTHNAVGTRFEAFMVVGDGLYLICNNTQSSMDEIAKDSSWLSAQVPFAELSEKIRSSQLVLAT